MRRLPYLLSDVFTTVPFGGNPLAVFTDRQLNQELSAEQMQTIARELNLSETVFVLPPADPAYTCRVRIFTPGRELPFAGHPTIGAAFVLDHLGQAQGDSIILEEGIGPVAVTLTRQGQTLANAEFRNTTKPESRRGLAPDVACRILGLPLDRAVGSTAAAVGVPFQLVELKDPADLARVELDLAMFRSSLYGNWADMLFVYARTGTNSFRARMFAPSIGVPEDPATGAACAALAAHLGSTQGDGDHRWTLEQGIEMGRPSQLSLAAEVQQGLVVAVRVGGSAVLIGEGTMWL